MNLIPITLLIVGGLAMTIGDVIMKKWIQNQSISDFWIGFLAYMAGMICLAHSFKYKNIAVASMLLVIFNVIALVIISHVVFQEKLSVQQMVGIIVGLVSVIILEL
jgi:multidrug transporter EmrE-like cation transporter